MKRRSTKPRVPLERQEQSKLIQWTQLVRNTYIGIDKIFAIPNGGSRNFIEAINLKRQGVKSGVPDLFLPVARSKSCYGLFIEMKRQKGGTVSAEQKEYIQFLRDQGYAVEVCKGFEEAKKAIENYYL